MIDRQTPIIERCHFILTFGIGLQIKFTAKFVMADCLLVPAGTSNNIQWSDSVLAQILAWGLLDVGSIGDRRS